MSSILAREIEIQTRNGASLDDVLDFARQYKDRSTQAKEEARGCNPVRNPNLTPFRPGDPSLPGHTL